MNKPDNKRYQKVILKGNFRRYLSAGVILQTNGKEDQSEHAHGSYRGLLFDPRWKAKRLSILQRDQHSCMICKIGISLQVHHRQYHYSKANNHFKPPWDYNDNLLITLCEKCHQKGHRQYKVPTIYI